MATEQRPQGQDVGVGVIGCGSISGGHLARLTKMPGVDVRTVCDVLEDKARSRAEEFGVQHWTTDFTEILEDERIEAVLVLVPQGRHAEVVVAAAGAGKHVFCEKPMAMTVSDCERMLAAVREAGVVLQIGYVMRFSEDAQKVKEWLERIGRPVMMRDMWAVTRGSAGRWVHDAEMGGGPMWENSHWIDFANWLLGRPSQVFARLRRYKPEDTTAWDTAAVVIDYAEGDVAVWGESWSAPGFGWGYIRHRTVRPQMDIIGPNGSIQFPGPGGTKIAALFLNETGDEPAETHEWESDWGATASGYLSELEHFLQCVRTGEQPLVSGEDGLRAVQIAEAAVESNATGGVVPLPNTGATSRIK